MDMYKQDKEGYFVLIVTEGRWPKYIPQILEEISVTKYCIFDWAISTKNTLKISFKVPLVWEYKAVWETPWISSISPE